MVFEIPLKEIRDKGIAFIAFRREIGKYAAHRPLGLRAGHGRAEQIIGRRGKLRLLPADVRRLQRAQVDLKVRLFHRFHLEGIIRAPFAGGGLKAHAPAAGDGIFRQGKFPVKRAGARTVRERLFKRFFPAGIIHRQRAFGRGRQGPLTV